jgi:hypothetical protein
MVKACEGALGVVVEAGRQKGLMRVQMQMQIRRDAQTEQPHQHLSSQRSHASPARDSVTDQHFLLSAER